MGLVHYIACIIVLLLYVNTQLLFTNAQPLPVEDYTTVQMWDCLGSYRQAWERGPNNDQTIRLKYNYTFCIDIDNYGTESGSNAQIYSCHTSDKKPGDQNQEFVFTSEGKFVNPEADMCLTAVPFSIYNGSRILLAPCTTPNNQAQQFNWNHTSGQITLRAAPNLCLDAGTYYDNICTPDNPSYAYPYCNYSLPYDVRVKDLVSRLNIYEKAGLFGYMSLGVPRLGIPSYTWWSEALHGVAGSPGVNFIGSTPYATSFPQVCTTGATFNKSLPFDIGHAVGLEGRAMNNVGHAGLTFWAPNINMFRDPRWGRGQETPGEDPVRTSFYVSEFVRGFQGGPDPGHLKASTCCKHYDAYSLEDWDGVQRYWFNAIVSARDLADTYLPAFESCANRGQSSGVMCSYNSINGVPSCANTMLITDYLRGEYGFQGYVTSDCGATGGVLYSHNYTKNIPDTIVATLGAGMDIDCGTLIQDNLQKYSADVPNSIVDTALTHLFMVQMRLGMFDPIEVQPYKKINVSVINSPQHQALALDAARQGMVLLKNNENSPYKLPLSKTRHRTIALLGPHGNATLTMQGNYAGTAPYLISPLEALKKYATVNYVKGCNVSSTSTAEFAAACTAARNADAVVLVMGLDQNVERETLDRYNLTFPGVQSEFIQQMASCAVNKPVVLVVMSGGPVDLSAPKANNAIPSMIWAGYPGQSGGTAIAEVLYGDYNPGGRLSSTVYKQEYVEQVSMFDMNMRPNTTNNTPGRSYRFYTGEPVYPFGHGMSYTTFLYEISGKDLTKQIKGTEISGKIKENEEVGAFSINVKNVGTVGGSDAVLSYVVGPDAGRNGNPIKSLVDFERVYLEPGQNKTIVLAVRARDLTRVTDDGKRVVESGIWLLNVGDKMAKIHIGK